MPSEEKRLFLLDAYALIYRAYYAFIRAPRINSKGLNTSAVYGFTNTLNEVITKYNPTHIAVAFDITGPTFRHDHFPEYKANREETPDDIRLAIPYIREIVKGFNIPIIEKEGFEADDVIGTIACMAEKEGFKVFMVTPDKDFGQLVTPNIFILNPGRQGSGSELMGVKEVCKKFEVENPKQVIDILGLWGDAVDNIPGIPGVGEKTAKKFIQQYGSVESLLEHTHEIKGKIREKIENNREQALLSKKLATIICDVPLEFDPTALQLEEPDKQLLSAVFAELEFRTMAERILGEKTNLAAGTVQLDLFGGASDQPPAESPPETVRTFDPGLTTYALIETKDKRSTFLKTLMKQKVVAFDTETTGLDPHTSELVGMSFSWAKDQAYYIPLPENRNGAEFILEEFKPFFEDAAIVKVGHNLKYDLTVLNWYGINIRGRLFDTMLAHYLIQPDMNHGLDMLAEIYLHYRPVSIEALIGKKGPAQKTLRDVDITAVKDYACEDADLTLQLYQLFSSQLSKEGLQEVFENIEMPLMPVLAAMETAGVRLDSEALAAISAELEAEALQLEKEVCELADCEFNLSSPRQLGQILFEQLKIAGEKPKKTKSGQYATNEETLVKYASAHPIIDKILEYRQIKKLKSTYVDALPELVNPRDGKIHTTYMQAVAATGRLSSVNPNLQNIPIRSARGREVRKAFVPHDEDHLLLSADYSQIELRLMTELSGDVAMMEAFKNGADIHAASASRVFGVPPEEVTREMRSRAKVVNFGIIYGISAFGLAQRMNISRGEAADIIKNYFEKYPGIKQYMDSCISNAREKGFVETIRKRRRYLPDINSGNATVRGFAERNAINAPIQGSAADMIKLAMISIHQAMAQAGMKSKMILQVHDELVFDAYKPEIDQLKELVKTHMVNAIPELQVPIIADMDTGGNWLEAH